MKILLKKDKMYPVSTICLHRFKKNGIILAAKEKIKRILSPLFVCTVLKNGIISAAKDMYKKFLERGNKNGVI